MKNSIKKQLGIAYILCYFGFGLAIPTLMPQPAYAEPHVIDSADFGDSDVIHTIDIHSLSGAKTLHTYHTAPIARKPRQSDYKKHKELTVFYKETKPFLTDDDGIPHGRVAEIVKDYGVVHNTVIKFVEVITMDDLIADVVKTENSMGIGAISITKERLAHVNFSVPYQFGDISLVFPYEITYHAMWVTIQKVLVAFRPVVIAIIFTALALTFCVRNPTIRRFWSKLWLSLVTGTTTGFDDDDSKTVQERVILSIWMVASIFIFSIFNASVFVTLNNQVNTNFNPTTVGVVTNTQGANICIEKGYDCKQHDNIKLMVIAFKTNQISSMIYDEEIIKLYVDNVAFKTLKTDMYGIIMNKDMDTYKMNRLIP